MGIDTSPYWEICNVETSKKIVSTLPFKTDLEKDSISKDILDSHLEKWGRTSVINSSSKQRTRKYKMCPRKEHQDLYRGWMDDSMLVYNATIDLLKDTSDKVNLKRKYELRDDFTIKKKTSQTDSELILGMERTPQKVREKANFEAIQAHNLSLKRTTILNPKYDSHMKALNSDKKQLKSIEKKLLTRKKGITELKLRKDILEESIQSLEDDLKFIPQYMAKTSNLKMRAKKDPYSNVTIPKSSAKLTDDGLVIYPTYLRTPLKVKGVKVAPKADFQIRLHRRTNHWSLLIPETFEVSPKVAPNRTVIIDPGIKTFLTCLDFNDQKVFDIGNDWDTKETDISRRLERIDVFSKRKTVGNSKKDRLRFSRDKKRLELDRKKVLNIIDNIHKQTARYLVDNYDVIVLPKLRSKRMLKKVGGLGKDVNRKINILSQCKFHDYLTWKAESLGKVVIDQNEAYTTKTCYECGKMTDIGGSRTFVCKHCYNRCGRDHQSCFNIMTRYMSNYAHDSTLDDGVN